MVEKEIGLFENPSEATVNSVAHLVEDVLVELGHFVNECRDNSATGQRAWRVTKGSATIRLSLSANGQPPRLRIVSSILTMDGAVDRAALFERLLNLNAEALSGAGFAVRGDEVQIVSERSTLDLDRSEVLEAVRTVESYADNYDDLLVTQFGGIRGGQAT